MKVSIRAVVREALINHVSRPAQLFFIMKILGVSKDKAKELLFAFLYNAEDEYLMSLALKD